MQLHFPAAAPSFVGSMWRGSEHATPNTPLCHIDYFGLKALEKQQVHGGLSALPSST